MPSCRPLAVAACIVASMFVLPAAATAAAPTLQAPAVDATVTEGATVTYSWASDLQGSPDARDRAYFVVEVIAASKMPAGQQAPWPDADTARPTEPGQAVTSMQLGAPAAGAWRWRVCAWGVVDPLVANELTLVPDGCSAPRSLTSKAAASINREVAVIDEQRKVEVRGEQTVVRRTRPAPAVQEPVVAEPVVEDRPVVAPAVKAPAPKPVLVQPRADDTSGSDQSALGLGDDSGLERAADRELGGGRSIADGLTATLPGIPIPFWTLGFLLAALPIALLWRRSVLGMFEWSDGSIDGYGTPDATGIAALASVQLDQSPHGSTTSADVATTAGASSSGTSGKIAA